MCAESAVSSVTTNGEVKASSIQETKTSPVVTVQQIDNPPVSKKLSCTEKDALSRQSYDTSSSSRTQYSRFSSDTDSVSRRSYSRYSSSLDSSKTAAASQETTVAKETIKIELIKGGVGLGFCIEGGYGSPLGDKPIIVKRLFKGIYYY